jgi:deoxycitidine kinase/deoxyguanosine kinase
MLFSVEGNIGSGKSTLIHALKKEFDTISNLPVVFVDEPVTQWQSIQSEEGKNMIELFYGNPSRYSFSFQMMAYISRLALLEEANRKNPKAIIITERCLLTDYNIFAKLLYENKSMLKEEYEIYQRWFDNFQDIHVDGIIYVRTDVSVSLERCQKRSRPGENIDFDYLNQCHEKHEAWMEEEDIPTLILHNNDLDQEEAIWKINDFIENQIWEYEEPSSTSLNQLFVLVIVYSISACILFINILNFQKNNQFHFDSYQK